MPNPATIRDIVHGVSQQIDLGRWIRDLVRLVDAPIAYAGFTIGDEGAVSPNMRRVTVQLRDRLERTLEGRRLFFFYIATSDGGDPAGTQTVSVTTGALVENIGSNDQALWVMTDSSGVAVIDITVVGASSRYLYADVTGEQTGSGETAWA